MIYWVSTSVLTITTNDIYWVSTSVLTITTNDIYWVSTSVLTITTNDILSVCKRVNYNKSCSSFYSKLFGHVH